MTLSLRLHFVTFLLLSLARCHPQSKPAIVGPGQITRTDHRTWQAIRAAEEPLIRLAFSHGKVFALDSMNGTRVFPTDETTTAVEGHGRVWWLPGAIATEQTETDLDSFMITTIGSFHAYCDDNETCHIDVEGSSATLRSYQARPHADIHGDEFSLDFPGSDVLSKAMSAFYWTSILSMVVEGTRAKDYPISDGFVISTLASQYSGTYPDVDHEFHIKGRVAAGSEVDLAVVRRMIDLDLKLAREDYCGLWRTPCAVQPDGAREYNVRRQSEDGGTNAVMFLVSGNVELIESVWLYVARTKDMAWLADRMEDLVSVARAIEEHIDRHGRLWSDVYYEDQVMKDGRETMSAALAARSFGLLADLLRMLGKESEAMRYEEIKARISMAIRQPLPLGYWDDSLNRFTDWVDRNGWAHDHIHLLANILPAMFGMAADEQVSAVLDLVETEKHEFQRFPTFLAARIQDYNSSEIGDGGPYDLCAAGRYWCWDAAFWAWQNNGEMLLNQLTTVAEMARSENYVMGERYDMNHVYYIDDKPWHGAAHYYEYPCVFLWVLLHDYVGVQPSLEADLLVAPKLADFGEVILHQQAYQLRYEHRDGFFELHNLADAERGFQLDLSALLPIKQAKGLVYIHEDQSRHQVIFGATTLRSHDESKMAKRAFENNSALQIPGRGKVRIEYQR